MNTAEYWNADISSLWHPYTKHSSMDKEPFPVIARGEGPYLYDIDGTRYLDAISSWWACNLGHSHPRLVEAIARQAKELQHSILGDLSHVRAVELASKLAGLFPGPRRVFFSSDGASAVEAALKIAVQYWYNVGRPERNRFAALQNAYHGDTLGAVSVGYMESFHKPFKPLLFPVYRAESPCCAACAYGKQSSDCGAECFGFMQAMFEQHAHELAAVIIEPLCQAAAGMRIYSPEYLKKLAGICRKHDVLMIADEIAVGMGRTGKMFAFEHAAIDPDIVCLGKGLSGGYLPLSAAIVKKKLFDTFADQPEDHTFYHGHTFAGNPIACAAALETLAVYEDENIVARARRLGDVLGKEITALAGLAGVANVRSLGMIGAVELAEAERAREVRNRLMADRILVRPLGRVVYLMLPLIVSEDLVRATVRSLRDAITE